MRVLTVDDSAVARRQIRKDLEPAGYEVLEAGTGEKALELLAHERVDLVTLDVHMPGLSGFETCQRIRAMELLMDLPNNVGMPVVFVTADDTLAGRVAGFEAGGADFIVKPFRPGSVRHAVDGLLRQPPARHGLTALVAEDSPLVRRITGEALRQLGISVVPAANGREAWELLRHEPDAVDLVVTDYIMPTMNGDRLCRYIRNEPATADLPVMVLSALDSKDYVGAILRSGATDFVPKPYVKEAFQSRLVAMLKGHPAEAELRQRLEALYGKERYDQALNQFAHPDAGNAFAEVLSQVDMLRDTTEGGMRGMPVAAGG